MNQLLQINKKGEIVAIIETNDSSIKTPTDLFILDITAHQKRDDIIKNSSLYKIKDDELILKTKKEIDELVREKHIPAEPKNTITNTLKEITTTLSSFNERLKKLENSNKVS